jgi:hypothetical protein
MPALVAPTCGSPDISRSLLIRLLRMENKFNIEHFSEMLLVIISLAVGTLSVGQTLVLLALSRRLQPLWRL